MEPSLYTIQCIQLERAKGELRAFVMSLFPDLDKDYKHTKYMEATEIVESFIKELEDRYQ